MAAQKTFGDFIALLVSEVENRNARTEPFLREATVRQLEQLSHERMNFMEATKDFQLTVGQQEYSLNYPDSLPDAFPRDLQDINVLTVLYATSDDSYAANPPPPSPDPGSPEITYTSGAYGFVIPQVTLRSIRNQTAFDAYSSWPEAWAWHHRSLIFDRSPSKATWLRMDYFRDGRLNDLDGTEIEADGTDTATNPWFGRGINILRSYVLAEYYLSIAKNMEAATMMSAQAQQAVKSVRSDRSQDRGNIQNAWEL